MNSLKIVQVDALTQLFNRAGWLAAVQKNIEGATETNLVDVKALLFIDLDGFKWVNDSLGHDAGDLLLQKVSRLIESCLVLEGEQTDIAGRFGGDEFVVWVQHSDSIAKLDILANAIVKKLSQPICLNDARCDESTEVEIGASIGIARMPQDAQEIEGLLKYADLAMYRAKHSGRNQVVYYKPEMMRQIEWRRQVQIQLRKALKQQQLMLDYLPVFDSKNQEVVALEAILNLKNCPDLMGMDVMQLMSIAEASQVGLVLGEWMVSEVIRFNRQLVQAGVEVACSIEIRPSHFQQKEFVDWLSERLDECELPPELLIVSLSERCLNSQRFSVLNHLTALSHLGVEIAIRSFGEGNWSLLRLHDWPIDQLNLSSRFVREMTSNRTMSAMTRFLIEMGLMLNKKVVACGVLSAEQIAFLNSLGCFLVQGPYLSEALSAEDMEVHLLQNRVENMAEFSPYYGEEE
ncbi:diguanylate cyclase/phosphodiesterase (GGDEF & EAL domains) with PAS/PAC sensor(s) [hydrothermal vent metagenome]|uniref:Diguanylate cyclase/phosphodiesterase (GGDEF & EAL domains) with PAS/PAC sensor(S) n=1 Tax=hydrothermal vent metagenome TaxID=652676 RepID=A0A3B0W906_9ZZZZ